MLTMPKEHFENFHCLTCCKTADNELNDLKKDYPNSEPQHQAVEISKTNTITHKKWN